MLFLISTYYVILWILLFFLFLDKNLVYHPTNINKYYLVNVAVSAAVLPPLNCIGIFPSLYNASALILVRVLPFPVTGLIPFILSSNSVVYNPCLLLRF